MKFTIGSYDKSTRSVSVTFTHQSVRHARAVNAVLKADGSYDAAATKSRVAEVASGVLAKIAAGAIA
ncbi:MAG: hypothetical protein BGP16_12885 [Sphingobium sp. 66-54]|nr:MAG: hypothetical protein BGP16_12885 [Sphingobium sp. 66-54]